MNKMETPQYTVGTEEGTEVLTRMVLPISPVDMENLYNHDLKSGIKNPEMGEDQNA